MAKTVLNGYDVTYVDSNTGEVLLETEGSVEVRDNTKTEAELKREEYINTHVMDFNKGERFVKMYTDVTFILAKSLKPKELQFAIGLAKFVSFEDCVLKIGYGKGQHDMTLAEISEQMETDYNSTTRIMKSLYKKGIIYKIQGGNKVDEILRTKYIANPWIYVSGRNIPVSICKLFNQSGWREFIESLKNKSDKI